MMGEEVCIVYRLFMRKSEGKRPLGGPRFRWEDNIKRDIREDGLD
jgi:hypothetical protein